MRSWLRGSSEAGLRHWRRVGSLGGVALAPWLRPSLRAHGSPRGDGSPNRGLERVLALGLAAGLTLGAAGCERSAPSGRPVAREPSERAAASAAGRTEAFPVVRLDEAGRRRAGIELAVARSATRAPEVEGYGRVLDPSALVAAIAGRAAARSALEAARRELRRVEDLQRDDQNASMREVEATRAAAAKAEAEVEVADARLVALSGPALAADPELGALAERLALHQVALVRIDVPAGEAPPRPELGAHLRAYPDRGADLEARLIGRAAGANPMLPGWGFLFLVTADPPPPGTPVRARVRAAGEARAGVTVPASALVRDGGRVLAFVQVAEGAYERRAIAARESGGGNAFVTAGIAPGEPVVAAGAEALLSAALLGGAGQEASDEERGEP